MTLQIGENESPEKNALAFLVKILETQPNLLGPLSEGRGKEGKDAGKHITDLHSHLLSYFRNLNKPG
jgi:hypothetical protein